MAGLEILFNCVQNKLKGGEDAIVCCLHWEVIAAGFKCIGAAEEVNDGAVTTKTEMLPAGWNASQDVYTLQYRPGEAMDDTTSTHLLKIVKMDTSLFVHFMRAKDEKVGQMTIDTSKYVSEDLGDFSSAFRNLDDLQKRFKTEVLQEVKKVSKPSPSRELHQETSGRRGRDTEDPDPLRAGPPRYPQRQPPPEWGDPGDPFAIGRGDLDPLAGGHGGGMVFDPLRSGRVPGIDPSAGLPGRLPRGAVPPGARFDPFSPPDLDRGGNVNPRGGNRPGPDPDHLPPPGYDDMFM